VRGYEITGHSSDRTPALRNRWKNGRLLSPISEQITTSGLTCWILATTPSTLTLP
jgi:hypothetical protein